MKERVAIYPRYSDEQQRETSIDDQIRRCKEVGRQYGLAVDDALIFADSAISGQAKGEAKRLGFQALLKAWDAGEFSVLIVDEFSRLSRDAVTQAQLMRRLESNQRVRMLTANGIDTARPNWQLQLGLEGIVSQQAGRDTRHRVVRGMIGQLERGYMIATPAFGYLLKREFDAQGNRIGSRWLIDEAEAVVVRDIFERRARGESMHEIARELNKSGVPTRRKARTADGGYWRPAAVRNLLSNCIYKGVFIWNGSTTAKARAKSEGRDLEPMHYMRLELRLVSDELWDRCNGKTISRSGYGGGKHALAGLVSCGCCHGTLVLSSVSRCRSLYCANCTVAKSSDGQKQRLTQTIATVGVQTLLVESARHFLSEDFVAAFRDALRSRLAGGSQAELDSARAELRKLERAQTRLLNILETAEDDDELLAERYAGIREQIRQQTQLVAELLAGQREIDQASIQAQMEVDPSSVLNGLFDADIPPARVRAVLARLFPEIVFEGKPSSRYESVFRIRFAPGAALAMASGTGEIDGGEAELRFLLRYSPAGHGGEAGWTVRRVDEANAESQGMSLAPSSRTDQSFGVSLHQA